MKPVALDPSLPISIGIDFGRTPAAAIIQKQANGAWYVTHELVTTNMSAKRFGEVLRDFIAETEEICNAPAYSFTGDPAGTQQAQTRDETPFQMLALSGIHAQPAPSNDFEERVTALDTPLTKMIDGEPAIAIHPRCTTLIKGLVGSYCFRRLQVAGEERYQDKPVKSPESHVCEALHYGIMGGGESQLLFVDEWEQVNEELRGEWTMPSRYYE